MSEPVSRRQVALVLGAAVREHVGPRALASTLGGVAPVAAARRSRAAGEAT